MLKRLTSILLAMMMVFGAFPVSAFAETENTLEERAYLFTWEFEEAFEKEISGFRSDDIEGTHIKYTFKDEDMTEEEVLEFFGDNGAFVAFLESPGDEYQATGIIVNGDERDIADYVGANGTLEGLGWIDFIDNEKLFNNSNTYIVTWENGSETVTDTVMFSICFPQAKDDQGGGEGGGNDYPEELPAGLPLVERARLVLGDCEEFFSTGRNGSEIVFTYSVEEDDTREKVLERILNNNNNECDFDTVLYSPDPEKYPTVDRIYCWEDDITEDFIDENGEIERPLRLGRIWFTTMVGNLCEGWRGEYTVVWSNGKTGEELSSVSLGSNIEASPAVFENTLVGC